MLFRLRVVTAISVGTDRMNWREVLLLLVTLLYFLSLGDNTLITTR